MMRSACNLMPRSSYALSAHDRDLVHMAALTLCGLIGLWPISGIAQGVPTVGGKAIILRGEEASREVALRTELETQIAKREELSRLHDEQIAALDATLAMLTGSSAFIGTGLEDHLRAQGVSDLVIVGGEANMCVESSTRMAGNLGFKVTLAEDALINFQRTLRDGTVMPAETVLAMTLANLGGSFARIDTSADVLAALT